VTLISDCGMFKASASRTVTVALVWFPAATVKRYESVCSTGVGVGVGEAPSVTTATPIADCVVVPTAVPDTVTF
jgi:hypothetical protein